MKLRLGNHFTYKLYELHKKVPKIPLLAMPKTGANRMGKRLSVDEMLIRVMQGQDFSERKRAWQEWYSKDSLTLTEYVFSRTHNWQLCEEIVHETFIIGFKKVSNKNAYQCRGKPLLAFLHGIAKNLIRQRFSERLMASLTAPDGKEMEISIPSKEEHIDSRIDREAIHGRLPEAMTQLSARQQAILRKRYLEDKSMNEVAAELKITRNLVGVETSRAKNKLKILLGIYYY